MVESIGRLAFEEDRRSGEIVLWADTAASMQRLLMGLAIATLIGLAFGLTLGSFGCGGGLGTFVAVLSMIPPMAILPILFIVFGLGELSKVVLIVFGIAPFLIRDLALSVDSLPREQLIKAQSLGASTWQIAIRVVLPQIMPRLIEALRLSLGPAFLFLISAEAIAADLGSAIASSWCAAIFRWTSSCPTSPGSRCSPISWISDWHGWRAAALPGPMRDGPDERDLAARCLGRI